MGPKASLYSGGYSSEAAARLSKVSLPERIKCAQCHRQCVHTKYSQKQLNEYRQRLLFNQTGAKSPKCRQCVGGPAEELTCHRCELTKSLDAFTKVQRRKPDTALCKDCQQEVADVEPNIEDALQEQEILETQTSIGSYSLYNYDSLQGSLPAVNPRAEGSDIGSSKPASQNSGNDLLRFSAKSSTVGDGEDGVWTGQGGANRRRAPSVASSGVSARTTGTAWDQIINAGREEHSYRARIGSGQTGATAEARKQSGNWAKQGAAKPDRGALREAEKHRETQRKIQEQERAQYEEEESSGSEWEL